MLLSCLNRFENFSLQFRGNPTLYICHCASGILAVFMVFICTKFFPSWVFVMCCFLHLGISGHWLFFVVDDSVSFRSQFRHQHLSAALLDWSRYSLPILSLVFYFSYSHHSECEVTVIYCLLLIYFYPTRMWTSESRAFPMPKKAC